jgi:Sulfotransferase family
MFESIFKQSNCTMRIRNIYFRMVKRLGLLKLKPVVFLHLQKTAGTSIINVARQFYGKNNIISHSDFFLDSNGRELVDDKFFQPEYMQNRFGNISFISGHFGYDFAKQFMADRYSFTFLRDPVERVLSFYFFCKTRNPNQFKTYELAQRLSLDEFLKLGFTDPIIKAHVWNYQASQLAVGWGTSDNLVLQDEELLDLAIQHLDNFSYVGFTETFEKDQEGILKDIGITIPVGNHKCNTNPGRPLFDGLPQSSKNLLLELTELDRVLYEKAWSKQKSLN